MRFYNIIADDTQKISRQVVSIIGGGGKTSLASRLGTELVGAGLRVILTTTTKISKLPEVPAVMLKNNLLAEDELKASLNRFKIAMVADSAYKEDRLLGIEPQAVHSLLSYADVVLVEADGSRQRSLKTHKANEPVIPLKSSTVIITCGADAVGARLTDTAVHRSTLFAEKWRLGIGTPLTPEIVAQELLSTESYLRNVPLPARVAIFINKTDLNPAGAADLGEHLRQRCDFRIFKGSLLNRSLEQIN